MRTRLRPEVAAARERRRRFRRSRLLVATALPALLVVGSAGAAVAGQFTTGITVIDQLLATGQPDDNGVDLRPGPGGASEPLRLPDSANGKDAAAVAYVSRDGRICTAQGDLRRRDDVARGSSGAPCYAPSDLARTLSVKEAICCGSTPSPDHRIHHGLAAADVVALRFYMENGATLEARLTPAWSPTIPGARPLRMFVAVDERDIDVGSDGVQLDEPHLLFSRYRMEAKLRDGDTVTVAAYPESK
jgi:hypothetical protein